MEIRHFHGFGPREILPRSSNQPPFDNTVTLSDLHAYFRVKKLPALGRDIAAQHG